MTTACTHAPGKAATSTATQSDSSTTTVHNRMSKVMATSTTLTKVDVIVITRTGNKVVANNLVVVVMVVANNLVVMVVANNLEVTAAMAVKIMAASSRTRECMRQFKMTRTIARNQTIPSISTPATEYRTILEAAIRELTSTFVPFVH